MNKTRLYCCLPVLLPGLGLAGVIQEPSGNHEQPTRSSPAVQGPDESILWALFHAGKIDALKRHIDDLRQRFPGWQVPPDLQNALRQPAAAKAVPRAATIKKPSMARRPQDGCAGAVTQWNTAEALLSQGHHRTAAERYEGIITGCKNAGVVRATLEKAAKLPDRADYFRLTALAAGVLPAAELRRLEYQWLKQAYLRQPSAIEDPVQVTVSELQPWVEQFRDADQAVVIAWRYFDQEAYRKAYDWFDKAEGWAPSNRDARVGKMLSLEKLGDYDAALALHAESPSDAKLNEIAGRLYKMKAWKEVKASRPQQAEQHLAKARVLVGKDDPEIQEIEAWIADAQSDNARAAVLFEKLYRQTPGTEYARAYIRNQDKVDRDVLARNAEQTGGLLLSEYRLHVARELYHRKLFLASMNAAPMQFPNLANIDAPSADIGVYARHKSGGSGPEQGLSRLDILKVPTANAAFTIAGIHNFRLNTSRVELSSGMPTSLTGSGITDNLDNGLETDIAYRMDGWFSPFVRLGHTPTGGIIDPAVTFDAGFVQQTGAGNWSLNVYSQPVRQSILSYTGIRDPNGRLSEPGGPIAREWGRVLRRGVKAAGYHRFGGNFGLYASAEAALLEGKSVADNTAIAASISPGWNIAIPGFDYFTIGPTLAYEHYEKNLSHFTRGHGGYFSPEHYVNSSLGVQFLSEEGRPLLFKGHVMAGLQFTENASAPRFPLSVSSETYQGDDGFALSDALDIELKGVWLMTPNLQLGAGAAVRHTANYEDYTGGLFVRFLLEERRGSYSSDIPDAMFNGIQAY
ncbi:MAG: hypothetical protein H6R26_1722 [Proteobacteria bacterium]|nr:hypothetical protein [Pseudomonadota bacterium]